MPAQDFITQFLDAIGGELQPRKRRALLREAGSIYNPHFRQLKERSQQDFRSGLGQLSRGRSRLTEDVGIGRGDVQADYATNIGRLDRNVGLTRQDMENTLADLSRLQGIERGQERENTAALGFSGGLRNKLVNLAEQERRAVMRRARTPYERQLLGYEDARADLGTGFERSLRGLNTQEARGLEDYATQEGLLRRGQNRSRQDLRSARTAALEGYAADPSNVYLYSL